ncbi:PQQ-dependent sugar dehydrogenase [Sorangium sp. So ce1335]|uniref:PQQ-dependent sugar dehydrogenase n=1 Tax=Sorangium sp. So ce1335 TaxID=3133335 RepID=UPI003F62A1A3
MIKQRTILASWLALALVNGACGDDGSSGSSDSPQDTGTTGAGVQQGSSSSTGGGSSPVGTGTSTGTDTGSSSGTSGSGGAPPDPGTGGSGAGEPTACDASAAPDVGKIALAPVVTGLDRLVYAAQPKGSSDWYLVLQSGRIRVFTGGALREGNFLDVSSQIQLSTGGFDDERGLLSIAFPPDYETSRKFYIAMTPTTGSNMNRDVVLEYQRSEGNPYVADETPTKTILRLDTSALNHNGGHVMFGPDGMLYVGTGDGGGSCGSDKPGAAQDPSTLFGKILRLDPNAPEPYAAAGNPLDGNASRVWHYGMRNPYRFSFDRLTKDLYIGDVGQDSYEEVDFVPAGVSGLNFGWPAFEGKQGGTCPNGGALRAGSTHTPPIADFDRRRNATGPFRDYVSVIGGYVYRGNALPQLRGVYLFGDYTGERMGALVQCGTQTSPITQILKNRDPNTPNAPAFSRQGGLPAFEDLTAIVEDNDGELYFVANRNSLVKLVPEM